MLLRGAGLSSNRRHVLTNRRSELSKFSKRGAGDAPSAAELQKLLATVGRAFPDLAKALNAEFDGFELFSNAFRSAQNIKRAAEPNEHFYPSTWRDDAQAWCEARGIWPRQFRGADILLAIPRMRRRPIYSWRPSRRTVVGAWFGALWRHCTRCGCLAQSARRRRSEAGSPAPFEFSTDERLGPHAASADTYTIQSVIACECGVVDCGDLVDWARMRATEAARRGGAAAWRFSPRTARRRRFCLGPGRPVLSSIGDAIQRRFAGRKAIQIAARQALSQAPSFYSISSFALLGCHGPSPAARRTRRLLVNGPQRWGEGAVATAPSPSLFTSISF